MMSNSKPVSFENKDKYVELGLNIAFYRKHAGLTQEELAERAGISRSHLSAIEAPNVIRPFSLEILFNIATALGVKTSSLLEFRSGAKLPYMENREIRNP